MNNGEAESIGIVTGDRFCVGCGYNVRTLEWGGRCPECGRSVWDSVRNTLRLADRQWLRLMQSGLWLLAASELLIGAAFVLARGVEAPRWVVVSYLLMPVASKLSLERVGYFDHEPAARWCFLLGVVVQGIGLLLLSRPEKSETANANHLRWTMRILSILMLLGAGSVALNARRLMEEQEALLAYVLDLALIFIATKRLASVAEWGAERNLSTWTRWLGNSQLAFLVLLLVGLPEQRMGFWMFGTFSLAAVDVVAVVIWWRYLRLLKASMEDPGA